MNSLWSKFVSRKAAPSWFSKISDAPRFPGNHIHHSHGEEDETYYLAFIFEVAVEVINSVAGMIILCACILAGLNMILVAMNSLLGFKFNMLDPMHDQDKATLLRIRQTLGEQTALALAILVAADVLDTVLKPPHAYELTDVMKMGFVTIMRTGLAYFLALEFKDFEELESKAIEKEMHISQSILSLGGSADGAGIGAPKLRRSSSLLGAARALTPMGPRRHSSAAKLEELISAQSAVETAPLPFASPVARDFRARDSNITVNRDSHRERDDFRARDSYRESVQQRRSSSSNITVNSSSMIEHTRLNDQPRDSSPLSDGDRMTVTLPCAGDGDRDRCGSGETDRASRDTDTSNNSNNSNNAKNAAKHNSTSTTTNTTTNTNNDSSEATGPRESSRSGDGDLRNRKALSADGDGDTHRDRNRSRDRDRDGDRDRDSAMGLGARTDCDDDAHDHELDSSIDAYLKSKCL